MLMLQSKGFRYAILCLWYELRTRYQCTNSKPYNDTTFYLRKEFIRRYENLIEPSLSSVQCLNHMQLWWLGEKNKFQLSQLVFYLFFFSAFLTSRSCTKSCVLKGIKIPKDSPILIPVYSIHRDPSIYPNPEKFDPERFSPAAKQSRNPYTYMPFGHGPHNCIGMRFAQMEMKLVLARILKKYRLEVAPDTKIPPDVRIKALLGCTEIKLRVVSRK